MKDEFYLVFRVYTPKERPNVKDRFVFFGWTRHKPLIDALKMQRDMNKYSIRKISREEMKKFRESYDEDEIECVEIDFVNLHSSHSDLEIHFITTAHELKETEFHIQEMMQEMCSLERIGGNGDYYAMLQCLRDEYKEALHVIGYRPRGLFFETSDEDLYDIIDGSYSHGIPSDQNGRHLVPSQGVVNDVANMSIYSIESFIKVLRDEL